jgi:hypothetical protein
MTASAEPHLFISVLGWKVSSFHCTSREQLIRASIEHGFGLTIESCIMAGVDRSRNLCMAQFLKSNATHHLFLDADLSFDPTDIVAMLMSGHDVVGGAYPLKNVNWLKVVELVKSGVAAEHLPVLAEDFCMNAQQGAFRPENFVTDPVTGHRYCECDHLGTGCLMVSRKAIEQYIDAYRSEIEYISNYDPQGEVHHLVFGCEIDPSEPRRMVERQLLEWARRGPDGNDSQQQKLCDLAEAYRTECEKQDPHRLYLTEDYSFCRRWKMLGGKVMCAIDVKLAHQGAWLFQGRLGAHFQRPQKADAA